MTLLIQVTEQAFQLYKGGTKFSIKIKQKWRHVDNFKDNICREIKSGHVKLNKTIEEQILKDRLLYQFYGKKVEWHFFGKADKKVIDMLEGTFKKHPSSIKIPHKIY